jgi:thermitase
MAVRFTLLALIALCLAPTAAQAAGTVDLIVRRDAGLSAAERADVRVGAGVEYERRLRLSDTELVSVPAGEAAAALRELNADPDVRWATRDGVASATAVTGQDTHWSLLWGLHNTGQTILGQPGIADADMDLPDAWASATGTGITVAVVDSGIQLDHADLSGKLATNAGETGTDALGQDKHTNGVDDDGNGLADDWRGWDFIESDNAPGDVDGHGTHVAGTIAAVNGNAAGSTGVAPDAGVLNLRALGDDGSGPWSGIADAFDLAGDMGVRIVNASLGGVGAVPAITQVINSHPNTLYVVSAGNDTVNLESGTDYFPCEAPAANVICIGASDNRDAIADFSNYGTTAVDVFAPGVDVVSTYPSGDYAYMSGTSMASPNVSGVAALLLARNPTLTAAQLKQTLMSTAEAKLGLPSVTGARANAALAVSAVTADRDGDGTVDGADSCPDLATADQTDTDSDTVGDLCDDTPRGHDDDGDGLPALDDDCPSAAGPAGNGGCPFLPADADGDGIVDSVDDCPSEPGPFETGGCPADGETPEAKPTLSRLTVTLSACTRKRGACRRRARVTARTSAATALSVVVERRRGGRWVRQASARRAAGTAVRLPRTLRSGRYRITVTASGAGGTSGPLRKTFTVRGR